MTVSLLYTSEGTTCWQTDRRIPACPLVQALTYLLDITSPPSQRLLYKLSQIATQEEHRQRLLMLATVMLKDLANKIMCSVKYSELHICHER